MLKLKILLFRFRKFTKLQFRSCKSQWPSTRQMPTKSGVLWSLMEILCGLQIMEKINLNAY